MRSTTKIHGFAKFKLIIILAFMSSIAPLSTDMYLPALSHVQSSFAASEFLTQLSLASFFIAFALGQLIYIDKPGELYRQHDNNVLGARTWNKRIKNWLKPQALVAKYWYLITSSQEQASLLRDFELDADDRALVDAFIGITEAPLHERLLSLKSYKLAKNRWFHTFIFRTLIITKFGYRRN